jgi:hypothetical protein
MEANEKAHREAMKEMLDAYREQTKEMKPATQSMRSEIADTREEMMAYQRETEACLEGEEPTSVDMEPDAAYQEVPREDAEMMPVGGPRKWRKDRNSDARRQGKPKERTQGKDGCRKKLVAARRGTTRNAAAARRR